MDRRTSDSELRGAARAIRRSYEKGLPIPILRTPRELLIAYRLLLYTVDGKASSERLFARTLSALQDSIPASVVWKFKRNIDLIIDQRGYITYREAQCLILRADGLSDKEIQDLLEYSSESSVRNLIKRAYLKASGSLRTLSFYLATLGDLPDFIEVLGVLTFAAQYPWLNLKLAMSPWGRRMGEAIGDLVQRKFGNVTFRPVEDIGWGYPGILKPDPFTTWVDGDDFPSLPIGWDSHSFDYHWNNARIVGLSDEFLHGNKNLPLEVPPPSSLIGILSEHLQLENEVRERALEIAAIVEGSPWAIGRNAALLAAAVLMVATIETGVSKREQDMVDAIHRAFLRQHLAKPSKIALIQEYHRLKDAIRIRSFKVENIANDKIAHDEWRQHILRRSTGLLRRTRQYVIGRDPAQFGLGLTYAFWVLKGQQDAMSYGRPKGIGEN